MTSKSGGVLAMKSRLRVSISAILLMACVLIPGTRLEAHHSFGAEYDADKPITLKGVITRIEWENPHCHIYVDVKEAGGAVKNWKFEGYPPNVLARTGFKKDVTLKIGDALTIFAWQARSGPGLAHARELTLANGKKLYFGPPAGTGEGNPVAP
jgi:hypothetical protein